MKKTLAILIALVISLSMASVSAAEGETVIVGLNAEFPPFEFVSDAGIVDGKYDGIDIAISLKIAEKLGKTLQVENAEFSSILAGVVGGKYDFAASGITATEERKQSVDFSNTYFIAAQNIITKADSGILSAADLTDKAVAVIEGYTGETIVTEQLQLPNIARYKKATDAVLELINGRVDAVVIDSHTAIAMKAANPDQNLVLVTDPVFETEEYAIAVQKGNTEMLAIINEVLTEMEANGEIEALVAQYTNAMNEAEESAAPTTTAP